MGMVMALLWRHGKESSELARVGETAEQIFSSHLLA
jgi:hypothetical protein